LAITELYGGSSGLIQKLVAEHKDLRERLLDREEMIARFIQDSEAVQIGREVEYRRIMTEISRKEKEYREGAANEPQIVGRMRTSWWENHRQAMESLLVELDEPQPDTDPFPIEVLRARVKILEAALEPFAAYSRDGDNGCSVDCPDDVTVVASCEYPITIGHCRRADRVLNNRIEAAG
jgi:hypothetical protein